MNIKYCILYGGTQYSDQTARSLIRNNIFSIRLLLLSGLLYSPKYFPDAFRFYCVVLALFIITEFLFFPPFSSTTATSKRLANEIKRYMKSIKARLKVESFEL